LFKIIYPRFYNYERLHSEIIGAIFNVHIPEIANKKYLEFYQIVNEKEEKIMFLMKIILDLWGPLKTIFWSILPSLFLYGHHKVLILSKNT
jgi:hypothetical protein